MYDAQAGITRALAARKPAPTRRKKKAAGAPKIDTDQQRAFALAAYPGLHLMAAALPQRANPAETRGRRPQWPLWVALFILAGSRIFRGGRNELIRWMRSDPDKGYPAWQRLRRTAMDAGGADPGPTPPSREWVRAFQDRFSAPDQIAVFRAAYRGAQVTVARRLGNLLPGSPRDLTQLHRRNMIAGDGTFVHRWSDTEIHTDAETGELFVVGGVVDDPSRARVQHVVTNAAADGKKANGINHVILYTVTDYGPIQLDVDQALAGESLTAMPMLEQMCRDLGDGLRAVVWDRAITGWMPAHLAAEYGVLVINDPSADDGEDELVAQVREDAKEALERILAPMGRSASRAQHNRARDTRLAALDPHGEHPLGRSVYESGDKTVVVKSRYSFLQDHVHDTASGPCTHSLWVDDGALVDVDPRSRKKVGYARVEHAELVPAGPGSRHNYRMRGTWVIDCGDTVTRLRLEYELDPRPSAQRPTGTQRDKALRMLRPLTRRDAESRGLFTGLRSRGEGRHAWIKRLLGPAAKQNTHRAVSLRPERQLLDMLAVGLLESSITWTTFQRANATAAS